MIASFPLETAIYTLAAIGVVAILREGWLWLPFVYKQRFKLI